MPTTLRLKQMEEKDDFEESMARRQPRPNPFGFQIPLTREEILADDKKKQALLDKQRHNLTNLMARNRGLLKTERRHESTPVINGYKMLKNTPNPGNVEVDPLAKVKALQQELNSVMQKGKFQMPAIPERDQVAFNLGSQAELKKRELKANQKQSIKQVSDSSRSSLAVSSPFGSIRSSSMSDAGKQLLSSVVRKSVERNQVKRSMF